MALKERFIEAVNAVLPSRWQIGAAAEQPARLAESFGQAIDADEANWRPLTGDTTRDLPLLTQERMLRIAHWLWEQNPLANRIVELPVAYLLSEGVKLSVKDDAMQAALDAFWKDPINDMDLKLPKKVRELAIYGEQCYPVFVDAVAGTVRLGYLDPLLIGEVVKDPDNPEQTIGIVTKRDAKGRYRKYRTIINGPESVFTARTQAIREGFTDGDCFYFAVNDLSSGRRGRSDLLHLADWLDVYDQFLFGEADRYKNLRALVWDLMLKNADENAVKKRASEFVLPSSGGAYVHNDSETLEPKTPKLEAADTSSGARLLRNHILSGASLPEHWFGGGGDVNRATAGEMGAPTFKVLAMRQRVWKHILESMARYVMLVAARRDGKARELDFSKPELVPSAIFPELVADDVAKNASALQQVVGACGVALAAGLLTKKTCVLLIASAAVTLGIEIDAEKELDDAAQEALEAAARDAFTDPLAGDEGGGEPAPGRKARAKAAASEA